MIYTKSNICHFNLYIKKVEDYEKINNSISCA